MANATQALRKHELPGRFDTGIVLGSLALAAFGLVMVASSSIAIAGADDPFYYVVRHAMFLGLGTALALWTPAGRLLGWADRRLAAA